MALSLREQRSRKHDGPAFCAMRPGLGTGAPRKASASKRRSPASASSLSSSSAAAPTFTVLVPGCVLIRNAIPLADQQRWIDDCLEYGEGRVAGVTSFYEGSFTTKDGYADMNGEPSSASTAACEPGQRKLNLMTKARTYAPMELYRERSREWVELAEALLRQAQALTPIPDLQAEQARINYYTNRGKIGWHFDRVPGLEMASQWSVQSPIVSFSLGNDATFGYRMRQDDEQSVVLHSGDCIIFGGEARMIWHQVSKVFPGTMPAGLSLRSLETGRLNVGFY